MLEHRTYFGQSQPPGKQGANDRRKSFTLSRLAPSGPDTSPFQSYPLCGGKLFRGACNTNPTGSFAVLNIRTKDTELDEAAIQEIARQLGLGVTSSSGLSKNKTQLHQTPRQGMQRKLSGPTHNCEIERLDLAVTPLCELSDASHGSNVRVSFHQSGSHSFYAVVAQCVSSEHLNSALERVKAVAGRLFELKEEPHFRDAESQGFRTKLATTTYL